MSVPAKVNQPAKLAMVISNGLTGLYPQAEIYSGGTLVTTIDLSDYGKGRYEGEWTPTSVGTYSALFSVYQDAGHTVELTPFVISREIEQIFVSQSDVDDLASSIARMLGLVHENAFIDETTYDANSMLLTARVRIYDSKANASLATDGGSEATGLVATYTITADYEGVGQMKTYRMVLEP